MSAKDWINGADKRLQRLNKIIAYIRENRGISKRGLVRYILLELGLRRRKVQEYLKILEEFGVIYYKGDKVYVKK